MDVDHSLDLLPAEQLRELLNLLEATGVELLEIEIGGGRLYLRREPGIASGPPADPALVPRVEAVTVGAPAVGLFHRGTEEGAPPLATEGDQVQSGQVLAVVEVLRMPHPVEAPVAGRVEHFLVESGQPVEYGQPLLVLVPVATRADEHADDSPGSA